MQCIYMTSNSFSVCIKNRAHFYHVQQYTSAKPKRKLSVEVLMRICFIVSWCSKGDEEMHNTAASTQAFYVLTKN